MPDFFIFKSHDSVAALALQMPSLHRWLNARFQLRSVLELNHEGVIVGEPFRLRLR